MQHFHVIADHNPLLSIVNTHRLDEIDNPWLKHLKARIMGYNFTAQWTKGSKHLWTGPTLPVCLQELQDKVTQDHEYQELRSTILNGFPAHRHQLPETCKRYWTLKEHLSIDDGLIIYGCRLLIPRAMRPQILSDLHESHQGIVQTKQQARLTVHLPGMDNNIHNMITLCQLCQENLPSNHKEPAIFKPKPLHPFQEIADDFCTYGGKQFLIIVGLARHNTNGNQHHSIPPHFHALSSILQHCNPRHSLVRWRTTV